MRSRIATTLTTSGVLMAAGGVALLLPGSLTSSSHASMSGNHQQLMGIVRDFNSSHPDFGATGGLGPAIYAGLTEINLGSDGKLVFKGNGNMLLRQARDGSGRNIPAHLADGDFADPGDEIDVLLVVRNATSLTDPDTSRRSVIASWGHNVTVIDDEASQSDFDSAIADNDVVYVSEQACFGHIGDKLKLSPIGVVSENPMLNEDDMGFSAGTAFVSDSVISIVNNMHPITAGFSTGDLSVADFTWCMNRTDSTTAAGGVNLGRINGSTKSALMVVETGSMMYGTFQAPARRVRLPWGREQAFVTGSSGDDDDGGGDDDDSGGGGGSPYCVWVTSGGGGDDDDGGGDDDDGGSSSTDACGVTTYTGGDDDDGGGGSTIEGLDFDSINANGLTIMQRSIEWAAAGNYNATCSGYASGDMQASRHPFSDNGGITSASSFGEWFSDVPGTNMSGVLPLTLVDQGNGTWVFDSGSDEPYASTGGFYPIDGQLLGNEGSASHNDHFTYLVSARFTYDASANQYLEISTDADMWVSVDTKLGIDMGGVHGLETQRLDIDRLCLVDGEDYWATFFLAQRTGSSSNFRVETNIQFDGSTLPTISQQFD